MDNLDAYALAMGHYAPGRYAWTILDPVLFAEPIPYRGQQGFFKVPDSVFRIDNLDPRPLTKQP